jgi:hypothetical protein
MRQFHICTLFNDREQYLAMRESFIAAGFTEDRCRYTAYDNTTGNHYEPYGTFNSVKRSTVEPYLIFCHQDLLMNRGDGYGDLVRALERLEGRDPGWAVAGNAGVSETLVEAACYTDPCGTYRTDNLPSAVWSLDENFLVVKTSAHIECTSHLHGFHLYGTDLCFHARRRGHRCYVIDFHLTHLSAGRADSAAFRECLAAFQRAWNPTFAFAYVQTLCARFVLSRYAPVRRLSAGPTLPALIAAHRRTYSRALQAAAWAGNLGAGVSNRRSRSHLPLSDAR